MVNEKDKWKTLKSYYSEIRGVRYELKQSIAFPNVHEIWEYRDEEIEKVQIPPEWAQAILYDAAVVNPSW